MSSQTLKSESNDNVQIKDKFIERYKELCILCDEDYDEFIKTSLSFLKRSIRVNTLKVSVDEVKKKLSKDWHLEPIPWCKEGFWIEHKGEGEEKRRDVGNLVEHSIGYIYLQESVSMIPPLALNPKPNDFVLDMCAAPGSKTTQIASMMQNKGILIANDYQIERLKPLSINMQRCGVTNSIMTLMHGHQFKRSGLKFDKILVDAPCSGTGTVRKSFKTLKIWNPNMIKRLSGTQKQLLQTGFDLLKDDGTLVYSTCSLEPEENEAVVSWLLENNSNAKTESFNIHLNKSKPILEFDGIKYHEGVKNCLRIWPQNNNTDGFFVCKIKKE